MTEKEKEDFYYSVYELVKHIPLGRACSYGMIAKAIGFPNHSRMVGKAMNECNSQTNNIPAHRVVNSQGKLSGREAFENANTMQLLLESEGLIIHNNQIQNWKEIRWNPFKEL